VTARENEENRDLWQGHKNSRTSSESKISFRWGFLASLLLGRFGVFLLFWFLFFCFLSPLSFPLRIIMELSYVKDNRAGQHQ
jgi:hypothetical protein